MHKPADPGTGNPFALFSSSSSPSAGTDINFVVSRVNPWKELFKRRPVGLNDGHEQALAVYSIDIRAAFVYIHTRYRTYTQTFRNVAINLGDWRGPPEIA
jgi:hypothetical protein